MAYAFINFATGSGLNSVTTNSVNMTGADFFIICVASYEANGSPSVTDSNANSYSSLTERNVSGDTAIRMHYLQAPSGDLSNISFNANAVGGDPFGAVVAMGFSGSSATPDAQESAGGTTAGSTTVQTGTLTPNENNELLIASVCFGGAATFTIDSSFIGSSSGVPYQVNYVAATSYGIAAAYKIQTAAGAENPTFTASASVSMAATQASFDGPGGGAGTRFFILTGH